MSQPGQARWSTAPPTGTMGTAINIRRPPTHTVAQGHTPPAPPPPPPPTLTPCFSQPFPRQLFPPGDPFQRLPTLPTPTFPPMPPPSQPTPHHTTAHTATASPSHTPSPRHSHATLNNSPTPATPPHGFNPTAQLPHDFVQTPEHWDNQQAFGLNLPRHIQSTAHSAHNRTAGLPIVSVPLLAFRRHSWSSNWLRYIAHGHEPHIVRTKHVNEAVFATELLGMLRARRIDLDQAAAAYCWEEKLTLAKRPALTQLVKELVIYVQELQDQCNQSNNTPAEKHSGEKQQPGEDSSKQNNPAPSTQTNNAPDTAHIDSHAAHRISDLEAKLASALEEADALRAAASHATQPTTPRRNTDADTRSPRTPPPNVSPLQALSTDNTPTSATRGTKRSHSPTVRTGLPIKDKSQDHIHMIDSPLSQHNAAPDTTQPQAASTTANISLADPSPAQRSSASRSWSPMLNAKPQTPRWTHSGFFSSQRSPAHGSNPILQGCIQNRESPDGMGH